MATTVENPYDTQQPKATNTGIVGGAMTQAATTNGEMPSNVGTTAPATPNVATYAPTTRQVNQPTDTVQGQVDSILSKDSPLMQRARTLATQQMAQRGLVNSSMAQGAGVAAMIDRATPIAAQDANAYSQASQDNMNAMNTSGQFNAGEINKFGLQTGEQKFQSEQAGINREFQTAERVGSQDFTGKFEVAKQNFISAQSNLDRAQQVALADKSIEAQEALQTAQQTFQGAQSALDRNQQSALQIGQQQFQASQALIQNDFNMQVQKLQESGQDFRQARDIATREAMTKLEQMGITNRFDQELALKSNQFNIEQNNLEKRQILSNQMELDKLGLQIKANNAQIPTNFAANISNTTMNGVNAVYAQPTGADGKPTAAERQAQVQSLVNYANSQISWAEKFYSTVIPRIAA